jgi:hypothetical protein
LSDLKAIGAAIVAQDNRATNAPIFAVQQRNRIYGLDTDYTEDVVWIEDGGDYAEAEPWRAVWLDRMHARTGETPEGWRRVGYRDEWEFVTPPRRASRRLGALSSSA